MSKKKEIALSERIHQGIISAQRKMLIQKAKLGESVVVADEHGQPRVITAEEALRRFEVETL